MGAQPQGMDWSAPPPTIIYLDDNMNVVAMDRATWAKIWKPDGSIEFAAIPPEPAVPVTQMSRKLEFYSPDQPRHPAGTPEGGQFAPAGGSTGWKQPLDANGRPIPIKVGTVEEAVPLVLEGKVVEVQTTEQAYTLIGRLANVVAEMRAQGDQAADFDLCNVTVAGTNLFCVEGLRTEEYPQGIPRLDMPQLGGVPVPGSQADKLPRNPWDPNEVDGAKVFIMHLQGSGISASAESVPAANLRASQRELVGSKVAAMINDRSFDPANNPLFISRDNYVVDGHHRWAAIIGRDLEDARLGNLNVDVIRVDAPITEVLHLANAWARAFGIRQSRAFSRCEPCLRKFYSPDQARVPAGVPEGGQFAPSGGGDGYSEDDITSSDWKDGEVRQVDVSGYWSRDPYDDRTLRYVPVLKNPTQREVTRWAGDEIKWLRVAIDYESGDVAVWDADDGIHAVVMEALGIGSTGGAGIATNSDAEILARHYLTALKEMMHLGITERVITVEDRDRVLAKVERHDFIRHDFYSPDQARAPAGTEIGGQWVPESASAAAVHALPSTIRVKVDRKSYGALDRTVEVMVNPRNKLLVSLVEDGDVPHLSKTGDSWTHDYRMIAVPDALGDVHRFVWPAQEALHYETHAGIVREHQILAAMMRDHVYGWIDVVDGKLLYLDTNENPLSESEPGLLDKLVFVEAGQMIEFYARKFTWDESAHPRGKTTEASTPGSFAPAEGGDGGNEPIVERGMHLSDAALEAIRAAEPQLHDLDYERALALEPQTGVKVFTKAGTSHEVEFTDAEIAKLTGTVFTHNHPSGLGFSEDDLCFAAHCNLRQIRATSRDRTYVMDRIALSWPEQWDIRMAYAASISKLGLQGKLPTMRSQHELLRTLAEQFPQYMRYSVEGKQEFRRRLHAANR